MYSIFGTVLPPAFPILSLQHGRAPFSVTLARALVSCISSKLVHMRMHGASALPRPSITRWTSRPCFGRLSSLLDAEHRSSIPSRPFSGLARGLHF